MNLPLGGQSISRKWARCPGLRESENAAAFRRVPSASRLAERWFCSRKDGLLRVRRRLRRPGEESIRVPADLTGPH